ncbi:MAG: PspC domain-containing protein, partial [Bacteroidales bacterium]
DFIEEEPTTEQSKKKSTTYQATKRLYRDPDNRFLGGVCGGLGAYFNIDPIVFRILFILIFFGMGSGLIIYIILWIAMPEAVTTAQKLEMRGEPVTVENIKKAVREEFENVRKNMKF